MDINNQKIDEFIKKVQAGKKGELDLSSDEDLSIAVMNLISIEEHFFFTGAKTGKPEYFDLLNTAREIRKELLKIYGVGPASVDYIMTGVYHRSILNTIMPWEAKIYSRLLGLKTTDPKQIMVFLDKRYGEHKSQVIGHLFMDISWKHKYEKVEWMEKLLPYA